MGPLSILDLGTHSRIARLAPQPLNATNRPRGPVFITLQASRTFQEKVYPTQGGLGTNCVDRLRSRRVMVVGHRPATMSACTYNTLQVQGHCQHQEEGFRSSVRPCRRYPRTIYSVPKSTRGTPYMCPATLLSIVYYAQREPHSCCRLTPPMETKGAGAELYSVSQAQLVTIAAN